MHNEPHARGSCCDGAHRTGPERPPRAAHALGAAALPSAGRPCAFNHHLDLAQGGVEGLAERALAALDEVTEGPAFICGESFGGTVALTLAHQHPERVRGLILFSTFGWHPSNLARRGAGALAVWSFLGHRVNNTVYRAGRLASLPSQFGFTLPPDLFHEYISRPRADARRIVPKPSCR